MLEPAHQESLATIYAGDCVAVMAALPEASIDAVVCDPPYGLEFMGKEWDRLFTTRDKATADLTGKSSSQFVAAAVDHYVAGPQAQEWHTIWARAAFRVLKPGGHLLAFGGSRTYHRLACAIEDAGFEIRDCLMWLYGSGFPKSLDVSKAMDKAAGAEREFIATRTDGVGNTAASLHKQESFAASREKVFEVTAPASDAAKAWAGWGTALKPAHEPIVLARKPLAAPTVAANVLQFGTGALNVDGCRIEGPDWKRSTPHRDDMRGGKYGSSEGKRIEWAPQAMPSAGRWPANVLLDEAAARLLDAQSGESKSEPVKPYTRVSRDYYSGSWPDSNGGGYRDAGGASRFFYTSKAGSEDRDGSRHPTVKPVDLMKWLITLVTPPGGVVLDPFLGSGTTVYAARALGIRSIGIEREPAYLADAIGRLRQLVLF